MFAVLQRKTFMEALRVDDRLEVGRLLGRWPSLGSLALSDRFRPAEDADLNRLYPIRQRVGETLAPVHVVLARDDVETLRLLLDGGLVPLVPEDGPSLLNLAAVVRTSLGCLRLLLERAEPGAVDRVTGFGTPLHEACHEGGVEAVRLLLDAGARLDTRAEMSGDTPLHYAARRAEPAITRLLIERSADLNAANAHGKTPLDIEPEWTPERSAAISESWTLLKAAGAKHSPEVEARLEKNRADAARENAERARVETRCRSGQHRWQIQKTTTHLRAGDAYKMNMTSRCQDCGVTRTV